jgi:hypothetical protein
MYHPHGCSWNDVYFVSYITVIFIQCSDAILKQKFKNIYIYKTVIKE